jgi:hypothetical protein
MRYNRTRAPVVVEDGSSAEFARNGMLVADDRIEIGFRLAALFDGVNELIEAAHSVELVTIASLGGVESRTKDRKRSVVRLERHWKRMPVLATVREGEARGVGKSDRRSVDHFGNERKRL